MAEIFRARLVGPAGFEKMLAIKRILPHLAQKPRVIEMLSAEAKIAALVQHRSVVQVFDFGTTDSGEYFIAMEYVAGSDLRRLLRQVTLQRRRIPPWFSVYVMAEILDALAYAHGLADAEGNPRNIVHRDVSPSNIFLSLGGEVKLGDFGVAKERAQIPRTRAGQLKGKTAYMSPEQLHARPLDGRSDVFSAGVVLWECLAQKRLFGGRPEVETMNLIGEGPRQPPSLHSPDVPAPLDSLVLKAIDAEPDRRWSSAAEFQRVLLELLASLRPNVQVPDVRRALGQLLAGDGDALDRLERAGEIDFARDQIEEGALPVAAVGAPPGRESDQESDDALDAPLEFTLTPVPDDASPLEAPRSPSPPPPSAMPSGALPSPPRGPAPSRSGSSAGHSPAAPRAPAPTPAGGLALPAGVRVVVGQRDASAPADVDAAVARAVAGLGRADELEPAVKSRPSAPALPALELRRRAAKLADTAEAKWESFGLEEGYEGPCPFWIQDHEGHRIGPCSFEQAYRIMRAEAAARFGAAALVSTNQQQWLDLLSWARLSGYEQLAIDLEEPLPKKPVMVVHLAERSLTSALSAVSVGGYTGRLILTDEGQRRVAHREIHLSQGVPMTVLSNDDAHQTAELMITRGLLLRSEHVALVHALTSEQRPIEELAARRRQGGELGNFRPVFMKEKLLELFSWSSGRFILDTSFQPPQRPPFARCLMQLLPEMVARAYSMEWVAAAIKQHLDAKLEVTRRFEPALEESSFNEQQRAAAARLAKAKKLSSVLRWGSAPTSGEDKLLWVMAYVLIEADMLRTG
jgi:serine/threonine-protein kinase